MSGGVERVLEPAWIRDNNLPPRPVQAAAVATIRRHLSGADAREVARMLGLPEVDG